MPRYYYERLSATSASHLMVENSRQFGHSATTLVFEPGPLLRRDKGVDFDAIRRAIGAQLDRAPRFRQKLKWIPYENHPVWVDDGEFNLDYHVRHSSLPRPGRMEQLEKTAARIMAQRLDRNRPLWECWVLEGLHDGGFALLLKVHHCMAEPGTGTDLLGELLTSDAEAREIDSEPRAPRPRPVPSSLELARDEVLRRARLPGRAAARWARFARESGSLRHELERRAQAVAKLLGYTIRGPRETPLNGVIGPHRRFDRLVIPLEQAQHIHRQVGGSVNDVILATVAGAVRRFFTDRFVNPATLDFRVAMPISVDASEKPDPSKMEEWIVDLPVWERDPLKRLAAVREQTERLAAEQPALAARTLFSIASWTGSRMLALGARRLSSHAPAHMTLLNVPGSPVPLYFQGARLIEAYPQAPLGGNNALGIAIFSYDGKLCFGLNADFDLVPDLARLREGLEESFLELFDAAGRWKRLELVSDKSKSGTTPERSSASRTKV